MKALMQAELQRKSSFYVQLRAEANVVMRDHLCHLLILTHCNNPF